MPERAAQQDTLGSHVTYTTDAHVTRFVTRGERERERDFSAEKGTTWPHTLVDNRTTVLGSKRKRENTHLGEQ